MTAYEKKYLPAEAIVSWGAFFILLATYWLTVAPTVSFWDCPEYVSAAYLLEVGHPPGNPVWMLVERIVTMLAPGPEYAALAINLSSGVLTAFAAFFLAKTIFRVGLWVLLKLPRRRIPAPLAAAGGALTGALAFGWCDSVWFSAVEAEVYAMSIFLTSLCVWLMTKWAGTRSRPESWRLLILIAYLFGLSVGVHQLNLLCIPALALIWAVRRGIRKTSTLLLILLLSFGAVGCVLLGMMPSTIALASKFEIIAVNRLGLPALSGVAIYVALLGLSLLLALYATHKAESRLTMASACFPAIFLSGIFILSEHFIAGMIVSAVASALMVSGSNFKARRLCLSIWMLAMLLTGYSSYALIPIRGSIPSPANSNMPGEPFAFASYQSREQYGSKPLLYGGTPYSRSMLREEFDSMGKATYRRYQLQYSRPITVRKEKGGRMRLSNPGLSRKDSAENARLMAREGDAYLVSGRKARTVKTPELNMWFPRITSSNPVDIISYSEWIGMDSSTMKRVEISEAFDSLGNPVGKMNSEGKRERSVSYRPTYLQNAEWFASYQTGYMYWRYLMWNFAGRQNDRPSQGEVQHGNFITGFPAIDNAMLGAEDYLPAVAGSDNKGRNAYYLLPLILGIIGMVWLLKSRRRGMQACGIIAALFVMTGLAIVVYLNQDPGEPRERDYSFLGSFLAYCIWIAFGGIAIARRLRSVWGFVIPLAVTAWMGFVNYDDHDRSGRTAARHFGANILNSLEPDAILFVNGDNYTFPLWYSQEVEGIRRDVRVVNLSYLTQPVYAANLMKDWRESGRLQTTLQRGDIIWDYFRQTRPNGSSHKKVDAVEALQQLREGDEARLEARYLTIPTGDGGEVTIDVLNLRNGGASIDFGRLMMLDIIATNAASEKPRPIYWIAALNQGKRLGLAEGLTPWLYGYRFGGQAPEVTDSLMLLNALRMTPPNPVGREVYMDHAPAAQVALLRGVITAAGRRMLRQGKVEDAVKLARKADIEMGEDDDSYSNIIVDDTVFNVRRELGTLLIDCADSLSGRTAGAVNLDAKAISGRTNAIELELRARGRHHLMQDKLLKAAWHNYRRQLPPRLRPKMAPIY